MPRPPRRQPVEIRLDPRLWRRLQQEAELAGLSPDEWIEEAVIAKIEDAVDVREGLAALEEDDWVPWEQVKEELFGRRRRAV